MMTMLRQPIDEPRLISGGLSASGSKPAFINFIHPGYLNSGDDKSDILLSLRALDDGGIDYATAHVACGILAANRWDGYFSRHRDGARKVLQPPDGILRNKEYYYCLPTTSSAEPYPIIARFSDWRFPHDALPPLWTQLQQQLSYGADGTTNSGHCCLSNYADGVELAHLVPSALTSWLSSNHMARYGQMNLFSTDPINAPANSIPLRSDIHKIFDERHFCFVPKETSATALADQGDTVTALRQLKEGVELREGSSFRRSGDQNNLPPMPAIQTVPCLVAHVFNSTPSGQLPKLWHNRRLRTIPPIMSVQCLFARFAWTVFSPTVFRDFLCATEKERRVLVWNPDTHTHEVLKVDPEKCRAIYTAASSRSESLKKRLSADTDRQWEENDDRGGKDKWGEEGNKWDGDGGHQDNVWASGQNASETADEPRGRTRKRNPR